MAVAAVAAVIGFSAGYFVARHNAEQYQIAQQEQMAEMNTQIQVLFQKVSDLKGKLEKANATASQNQAAADALQAFQGVMNEMSRASHKAGEEQEAKKQADELKKQAEDLIRNNPIFPAPDEQRQPTPQK